MLLNPSSNRVTPESVYSEKYDWLLRWALHFCGNDRSAAEDLVQDVFTQLLVSWPSIHDTEHPEKLLYTYLKYGFLRNRRRDRRYSFQALSAIDFESLHLSLRRETYTDAVELQDELRSVVTYLSWRKQFAKCASILILRFFHGFFPSEIMQIALLTRRSVDTGLAQAREETKVHLANPTRVQAMHYGLPPAQPQPHVALTADDLMTALRAILFESCAGECLPDKVLHARYTATSSTPIECELLAHIVSCPACLERVCRWSKIATLEERSPEEAWGFARRDKAGPRVVSRAEKHGVMRSMRGGEQRFRAAFEHRPEALLIAVDGEVLAARDIGSKVNHLQVEIRSHTQELIEVMSEQELPLLTLPLLAYPPPAQPSLHREAVLAGGQTIDLLARFTTNGVLVELTYVDPMFGCVEELEDSLISDPAPVAGPWIAAPLLEEDASPSRSWRRYIAWLRKSVSALTLWHGLAAVFCVLLAVGWPFWRNQMSMPSPDALLTKAVASEVTNSRSGPEGVVAQTVRITTPNRTLARTLHRDAHEQKRPRQTKLGREDDLLATKLASAGISWNDPLSSASYRDWHDHAEDVKDSVERTGIDRITLTTVVNDGIVTAESLTVRESDLHAIARTVHYRDSEQVEIAEVDYGVLPWKQSDPGWFESERRSTGSTASQPAPVLRLPHTSAVTISEAELDVAELSARVALAELKTEANDRIELARLRDGVHVRGLVPDEARKREIATRLQLEPHVVPEIRTFAEFEQQSSRSSQPSSIVLGAQGPQMSPLEHMLQERNVPAGTAGELTHAFFESRTTVEQSSRLLDDLERRFRRDGLPLSAEESLDSLESVQYTRLHAAIEQQQQALARLGVAMPERSTEGGAQISNLPEQAAANGRLCNELISQDAQTARPAAVVLPELAASLAKLQSTAEQIHIPQAHSFTLTSSSNTTHQTTPQTTALTANQR